MTENKLGRPTIMTPEKVKELEGYFSYGATDVEACFLAEISKQTLYTYQENNPDFVDRKKALKRMPNYKAKKLLVDSLNKGNITDAKWYLERKDNEFKQKTDITSNDETIKPLLVEFIDNEESNNNTDTKGV